ncbi:MAG TPA: hypothetical protein VGC10_02085 [Sphingomonas sp.]
MRARTLALLAPLACALLLSACGKPKAATNSLDAMDSALLNGAVTAERTGLAAAIKVDPARLGQGGQERPATTNLTELARRQAAHQPAPTQGEAPVATGVDPAIAEGLVYSNDWATKLPADLPMMAGATLQEAAGRDGAPLTMRVVSFTAPGDRSAVLAWYAQKARAAGYSAARVEQDGDLVLQGEKPDGAAYVIMAGATAGGRTPIDYVWTHG